MTFKSKIGNYLVPRLPFNRRFFNQLRFEMNAVALQMRHAVSPFYRSKVLRLRKMKHISLNVGSGGRGVEGWINTDFSRFKDTYIRMDVRKKLPFADGSVQRIFAEHVIEHLDFRQDVPSAFSEFYRVLEKGGRLRIIVPDAEKYVRAYASDDHKPWEALGWNTVNFPENICSRMDILNHVFHQGGEHAFAYDFETMAYALKKAGFQNVSRSEFRKSADEKLNIDSEEHKAYSLYVEAVK